MGCCTLQCTRIVLVILLAVLVGLGLYVHLYSGWSAEAYEVCVIQQKWLESFGMEPKTCPPIEFEYAFLGIIITAFVICFILLIVNCMSKNRDPPLPCIDMTLHILVAILLLIGAVLIIMSAVMINNIYGEDSGSVDGGNVTTIRTPQPQPQPLGPIAPQGTTSDPRGRRRRRAAADVAEYEWEPMEWDGGPVGRAAGAGTTIEPMFFPLKLAAGGLATVAALLCLAVAWMSRGPSTVAPEEEPAPEEEANKEGDAAAAAPPPPKPKKEEDPDKISKKKLEGRPRWNSRPLIVIPLRRPKGSSAYQEEGPSCSYDCDC